MIEAEGWVLVVLLRLSPIVPWNLLNIAMATTRMHFLAFTIASAIGALHTCQVLHSSDFASPPTYTSPCFAPTSSFCWHLHADYHLHVLRGTSGVAPMPNPTLTRRLQHAGNALHHVHSEG